MQRQPLLINPSYYEFGDYGYHEMPPMGLLKIARYLKNSAVNLQYLDCSLPMRLTDTGINLKEHYKSAPFVRMVKCGNFKNEGIMKPQKYYGLPHSQIRQAIREAKPTEIWLTSGLTYYWEAMRDIARICKDEYPKVPLLVGGIYPTLYPDHADKELGADYIHIGPLEDIDSLLPDYTIDYNRFMSSVRTIQLNKGCNVQPACSFCLPDGEKVFTYNHAKNIEQIGTHNWVLTEDGQYERVLGVIRRHYIGKLVSISIDGTNIKTRLTANHKIDTQNGIKEAKDIVLGDKLIIPLPLHYYDTITVPPSRVRSRKKLYPPENINGYGHISITPHFARLLGYFSAEGHISRNRHKEPSGVVFTFNKLEHDLLWDVENICKETFNTDLWITDKGTGAQIGFSSGRHAEMFIEQCGSGAGNKKIPHKIMGNNNDLIKKEFIRGLWYGDGSVFRSSETQYCASYSTISYKLAWDLWRLLKGFGYNARLYRNNPPKPEIQGRKVNVAEYRYQVVIGEQNHVYHFCSDILNMDLDNIYHGFVLNETEEIKRQKILMPRGWIKVLRENIGISRNTFRHYITKDKIRLGIFNHKVLVDVSMVEIEDWAGWVNNIEVERTHKYTTSIGLVHNCSVVSMDPKFIPIDVRNIFNYIQEQYDIGATFFRFWASQLLVPKSRFLSLMNLIIDSDMKIRMVASEGVQPDLFTQDVSDAMKKAGFVSVSIPMESIDSKETEDFRKPADFNDYEKAVACAQNSGFGLIKSFVMIGIPGQNYDNIVHAIVDCWARDVMPALHQYTPIPGSYDWSRFTQFHDKSPEELHPSLWPGASEDLKVTHLEEIKRITKIGLYNFCKLQDNPRYIREPSMWDLFKRWCVHYGLINSGYKPTYRRPLSIPEYKSDWTKRVENAITSTSNN